MKEFLKSFPQKNEDIKKIYRSYFDSFLQQIIDLNNRLEFANLFKTRMPLKDLISICQVIQTNLEFL